MFDVFLASAAAAGASLPDEDWTNPVPGRNLRESREIWHQFWLVKPSLWFAKLHFLVVTCYARLHLTRCLKHGYSPKLMPTKLSTFQSHSIKMSHFSGNSPHVVAIWHTPGPIVQSSSAWACLATVTRFSQFHYLRPCYAALWAGDLILYI